MMKIITTYEYSNISYDIVFGNIKDTNSFSKIQELEALFNEKYAGLVEFKFNGIHFRNFVGVIKVGEILIEVLPKIYNSLSDKNISLTKNEIYKSLNYMINKSSHLSIRNIDITKYGGNEEGIFLDFFINMFLQELYNILFKGIYKTYVTQQGNLRFIKGRLLVAENLRMNIIHNKVYCEFDEFTEDNLVNQILKYTTRLMSQITNWKENQLLAENITKSLIDVNDIYVNAETFSFLKEDRLLGTYSKLLNIAKIFIERQFFNINGQTDLDNFIFNIDMNMIYQEYIYELLNEYRTEIFNDNVEIKPQYSEEHLVYDSNNTGVFPLIPDIAVLESGHVQILIDTKYKKLDPNKHRNGVSDRDLYQMFGYFHKYNNPTIVMLYPRYNNDISDHYKFNIFKEPSLFVYTIPLPHNLYSSEGEKIIVESLKQIFSYQSKVR